MTFEEGFADAERAAGAATRVVGALTGALRQFHRAAQKGELSGIRKTSERLVTLLESTRHEIDNTRSAWPFSPEGEEEYFRDSYASEIMNAARTEGLQIQQRDEGLVAFPSIVRILPLERAVRINRKKVQAVRPSFLVKSLKITQAKKPKATQELFLDVLHRVYCLVTANEYGNVVALAGIYDALTILPGSKATYDHTDFLRDLFLLDRSGVHRTKSGALCSLPASTGTKASKGKFSFVAPDGEAITYYGIRFTEAPE